MLLDICGRSNTTEHGDRCDSRRVYDGFWRGCFTRGMERLGQGECRQARHDSNHDDELSCRRSAGYPICGVPNAGKLAIYLGLMWAEHRLLRVSDQSISLWRSEPRLSYFPGLLAADRSVRIRCDRG